MSRTTASDRVSSNQLRTFGFLALGMALPTALFTLPAIAGRFSNGKTFFERAPQLLRAAASNVTATVPGATYEFTLTVPADAGESLQSLFISQDANREAVQFSGKQLAFAGDRYKAGPAVTLAKVVRSQPDTGETKVVFDPPIQPGTTVTVALEAKSNPSSGAYLFGLTAYPAGENGIGQFLGYGRLHFYNSTR